MEVWAEAAVEQSTRDMHARWPFDPLGLARFIPVKGEPLKAKQQALVFSIKHHHSPPPFPEQPGPTPTPTPTQREQTRWPTPTLVAPVACTYTHSTPQWSGSHFPAGNHLPQISLTAYARFSSTVSRTVLTQTFVNPSSSTTIPELRYTFPLHDGVSLVGFACTVKQGRVIRRVVKEKQQARQAYDSAVSRGYTAGLVEQLPVPSASDVFHYHHRQLSRRCDRRD